MDFPSFHSEAIAAFDPTPSIDETRSLKIEVQKEIPESTELVGYLVGSEGNWPNTFGVDRASLERAGFDGKVGQAWVLPQPMGPAWAAVALGLEEGRTAASFRHAAAAFARAGRRYRRLTLVLPLDGPLPLESVASALVEGTLLARYRYRPLKRTTVQDPVLETLTLVVPSELFELEVLRRGAEDGRIRAEAAELARDLANAPASLLTARRMESVARALAEASGLEIEVFDEARLAAMGCGGMLGVNAGSAEPPRLIKLTYRPADREGRLLEPIGRIALIGKGIMFDSGGLGLKPNDLVHASMKTDMSGSAAILAAMSALSNLSARAQVTGYLMCTDNMPGGKAMRLGDVLTARGGKTVEVVNTDAEGRLVMMDGLVLATEETPAPDAIVDIATLTGACERALGNDNAGVMGNDAGLVDQVRRAAEASDETVWEFPLDRRLREELESEVADLKNVGGTNAGQITAALFLEEFVAGIPWAHIDMAGTSRVERDKSWRSKGATGYGTRLLIELILSFAPPRH